MNAVANATPDQPLQLPSLVIKNFRGIDELTIPRLGRVTLLAGKNSVGKTTVLDAVQIWAARGDGFAVKEILRLRGDVIVAIRETGIEQAVPDWSSLFYNRLVGSVVISLGPIDGSDTLQIRERTRPESSVHLIQQRLADVLPTAGIEREFGNSGHWIELEPLLLDWDSPRIICNVLGPDISTDATNERFWNHVALSPQEDRAVEALNLVTDIEVERVAIVASNADNGITYRRRLMAKLKGRDHPVPVRSLGEGAVRTFALALALAYSADGFLLIDEVENGLHHSVQPKFWDMVLRTAQRNNVQVIATTHSWDCVTSFAQAANELEDVEGILVRIERPPAGLRAITYDEARLENIAKYGIEVR